MKIFFILAAFTFSFSLLAESHSMRGSASARKKAPSSQTKEPGQAAFGQRVLEIDCLMPHPAVLTNHLLESEDTLEYLSAEAAAAMKKQNIQRRINGAQALGLIEKLYREGVISPKNGPKIALSQGEDRPAISGPSLDGGVEINLDKPVSEKVLRDFFSTFPSSAERRAKNRTIQEKAKAFTEKTGLAITFSVQELSLMESGLENLLQALKDIDLENFAYSELQLGDFSSSASGKYLIKADDAVATMKTELQSIKGEADAVAKAKSAREAQKAALKTSDSSSDPMEDKIDPFLVQEKEMRCAVQKALGVTGGIAYDTVPDNQTILDTYAMLKEMGKQGYRLKPPAQYLLVSTANQTLRYYDNKKLTIVIPIGTKPRQMAAYLKRP